MESTIAHEAKLSGMGEASVPRRGRLEMACIVSRMTTEYPVGPFVQEHKPEWRKSCGCGRCGS